MLVISRQATRGADTPDETRDIQSLGSYFDRPAELVGRHRFSWTPKQIQRGTQPIDVTFSSDHP